MGVHTRRRFAVLACLVASLMAVCSASAQVATGTADGAASEFRALWITRWDYLTRADVERAIREAKDLGVTDIMWQARGQCDAFYKSDLEPWGRELFAKLPGDARDPGYDPLALAVERAHAAGLRIHAWVNVYPLWKGTSPPPDPAHAFNAHPDWRLHDAKGQPQALNEHYVIVNPLLPEVQDHVVKVCRDIVTRYAVDGLHLDYVRFVSDTMKDPAAYPADERSIGLFRKATGRAGITAPEDQAAFRDFKRDQITLLVRRLKDEAVKSRPGVVLTAAVWRRPDLARDSYLQDAAAWLRAGVLDRAMPMIYTAKDEQFDGDLAAWLKEADGQPVSPGIALYMHGADGAQTIRQIEIGGGRGASGLSLFAYSTMFESADPTQLKDEKSVAERAARLKAVAAYLKKRGAEKK
jgi:uncharacterized lipoprotein YddW (UPF0748 family)